MKRRTVSFFVFCAILYLSYGQCICIASPLGLQVRPLIQKICFGTPAELTLEAADSDPCYKYPCDDIILSGWPPADWSLVSSAPMDVHCMIRQVAGKTFDQPGIYSYTITAADAGQCASEQDPDVSETVQVWVCQLTLSAPVTELDAGCGESLAKVLVTCNQSQGCDAFGPDEPGWEVTGPLYVSAKGGNQAEIHSMMPTPGCTGVGTVRASAHGCVSNPVEIRVNALGPFSMTLVSADDNICYDGTTPWGSIPEPRPLGVEPTDPVYGCVRRYHYQLCIGCPPPRPLMLRETVDCADECNCPEASFTGEEPIAAGGEENQCIPIRDSHMALSNDCLADFFATEGDFKRKQRYYVDTGNHHECELMKTCIHYHRTSPDGTCYLFNQTVDKWTGWESCNCQ